MEIKNETVTLSLQNYEDMKQEIKTLKEQVKEKTIVKYQLHPVYGYVRRFLMCGMFSFLASL